MGLFGPSRAEIWRQLAEGIGAEYVEGGWFGKDAVVATHGVWTITLDVHATSSGDDTTYNTRMRAAYNNPAGFIFTIDRADLLSGIGKFFGMQDVETGDPEFDQEFVLKTNDEARLRALLADPHVREQILLHPRFHLTVKDDEGWFGPKFPEGTDELYFEVSGIITELVWLRCLFDTFAAVLERLTQI